MVKTCSTCRIEKEISLFHKRKNRPCGVVSNCKNCEKQRTQAWRLKNKDKYNQYMQEYRKENIDTILPIQRASNKKSFQKNKQKIYKYRNEKRKTDINFRLACNLRTRFKDFFKHNTKSGSAVKDLGCSVEELKQYLESKFQPGMSWDNYSREGWHIDHIIPLSKFNLSDREEFLKACHYTNLQPLWALDNLQKSNKILEAA